jgi:hypothetical protein
MAVALRGQVVRHRLVGRGAQPGVAASLAPGGAGVVEDDEEDVLARLGDALAPRVGPAHVAQRDVRVDRRDRDLLEVLRAREAQAGRGMRLDRLRRGGRGRGRRGEQRAQEREGQGRQGGRARGAGDG